MEIKISKGYIKTKDDFIKAIKEKDKEIDVEKEDKNIRYEKVILIKNYLISEEFNDILSLPIFKYSLNKLIKINLTANELETIPPIFLSLTELKILTLNNNKIKRIENLENLSKLEKLELRGNKIKIIEGINNLNSLCTFTLSCNLINIINENDLPKLHSLKELGLFGNYIGLENKTMDLEINKKNIECLENLLRIIKEKFENLEQLYIGGNYITNLIENNKNNDYTKIVHSVIPGINIDGK